MLSSQTKDQITAQAMTALKSHGLTIENIIETPEEIVAQLIHPVGFWRKKAGYIKRASQILLDKYGGDIPTTMDELVSYSCMCVMPSHSRLVRCLECSVLCQEWAQRCLTL
jgi:endonuclease-3